MLASLKRLHSPIIGRIDGYKKSARTGNVARAHSSGKYIQWYLYSWSQYQVRSKKITHRQHLLIVLFPHLMHKSVSTAHQ